MARILKQNEEADQKAIENDLRERQRDASDLITLNGSRTSWVWADASPRGHGPSVRIARSPMGGSELFATRHIEAGEVVLRESPAFVAQPSSAPDDLLSVVKQAIGDESDAAAFLAGQIAAALDLFQRSSLADRVQLVEGFFCTPDAGGLMPYLLALVLAVQRVHVALSGFAAEDLARVLCVWLLASHNLSPGSLDWSGGAGLFAVAHRANHSCAPAVAYRYDAATRRLVYRAVRPIRFGEAVTFSYLFSHELMMPTFLRRRMLETRKYFRCVCSRCCDPAPESGRSVPCEACSKRGGGGGSCGSKAHRGEGSLAAGSNGSSNDSSSGSGSDGVDACGGSQWERCTVCSSESPPTDETFAREEELCQQALTEQPLSAEEQIRELESQPGWHRHWTWSAALWRCGLHLLRGGVWEGDEARARLGWPLLQAYVRWADEQHGMSSRHYLASRMAETFACLAAFVSGTQDQSPQSSYEAAALAVKLCAPYLRVLEYEYGEQDEDCKKMRRFFVHYCGHCGKRAPRSLCSRCKVVSYCSPACQKAAWPEHKRTMCGADSRASTPTFQTRI